MISIEETIERYVAAWNAMNLAELENLWHANESGIYYVAEEIDEPFYAMDSVVAYWRKTARLIERVSMTLSDQRTNMLSDKLCVVTFSMLVDADMRGAVDNSSASPANSIGRSASACSSVTTGIVNILLLRCLRPLIACLAVIL